MIDFTRGVPAPECFPVDQLAECAAAAISSSTGKQALQYGKSYGFVPLREWIAARHNLDIDQVMLANGSLQLIDFLGHALLQPGDTVFVEVPTYDRTLTLLRRHGAHVVGIPQQDDGPDLEALEAALAQYTPKLFYLIVDFQNPSGITTSRAKRERLAQLAEQHGFWLVEDAPYRALRYRGTELPALFDLAPQRTLQLSSFSKLISPGVRVGYMLGDADVLQRMAQVAEDTYITPVLISAALVHEFCRRGYLEPQIERLQGLYAPRLNAICSAVHEYLPTARGHEPDGGFFLSVTLPEGVNSAELRSRAAAAGVKCSDGRGFFVDPVTGDRFLRLPFCALPPDDIVEGVRRIAGVVNELTTR